MQWKYCEEKLSNRAYWKASGLINGHIVELFLEDDFDYGITWKVESGQYGTYFSKPKSLIYLSQAKEEAEALFFKLEQTYKGRDD
jgi:hypothetical protein